MIKKIENLTLKEIYENCMLQDSCENCKFKNKICISAEINICALDDDILNEEIEIDDEVLNNNFNLGGDDIETDSN